MRITNLEIQNFRGINSCNINFPSESRVLCLIGAGDSTKSTILKAIEWVLWPTWNLIACDNDFYAGDTNNPIMIRGTFTEIPDALLAEDKFGLYLRRNGIELNPDVDDEPIEDSPVCLTIELAIDASLEPKWMVVCNRKEPKSISNADRRLIQTGFVGDNCSKDMVWGKHSVLQKYANSKDTLHEAYTTALRDAINKADLSSLDAVSETIVGVGKQYGVGFDGELKSKIMMQNGSFSSTVGVFEGPAPLSQRGTGSQKLLRSIKYAIEHNTTVHEGANHIRKDAHLQKRYSQFKFLSSRTLLSKGLEFDCVIIDTSDKLSVKDFYVAMTRAKKKIFIISPTNEIYFEDKSCKK